MTTTSSKTPKPKPKPSEHADADFARQIARAVQAWKAAGRPRKR